MGLSMGFCMGFIAYYSSHRKSHGTSHGMHRVSHWDASSWAVHGTSHGTFNTHGTSRGVHCGTHMTSHGLSCSTGCIVLPMRCIELPLGLVTSDGKAQGRPRGLPMGCDRPHITFPRDAYLYPRNSSRHVPRENPQGASWVP